MSDFPVEQESERLTLDEIAANLARIGRSGYGALPDTPERFPESSHVDSKYWAELVRARRQIAESEIEVQQLRSALARQAIQCSNARFDLLNESRKERAAVEPEQFEKVWRFDLTERWVRLRLGERLIEGGFTVIHTPVEPAQVDPQTHDPTHVTEGGTQ